MLLHVRGKNELNDCCAQNVPVFQNHILAEVIIGIGEHEAVCARHMVIFIGTDIVVENGQGVFGLDQKIIVET